MNNWLELNDISQIELIKTDSFLYDHVILKHSTRCSISDMALGRLNRSTFPNNTIFYLLDLIAHRDISNKLSEQFQVHHESPQILIIRNGECIYDESHNGIQMQEIVDAISAS